MDVLASVLSKYGTFLMAVKGCTRVDDLGPKYEGWLNRASRGTRGVLAVSSGATYSHLELKKHFHSDVNWSLVWLRRKSRLRTTAQWNAYS